MSWPATALLFQPRIRLLFKTCAMVLLFAFIPAISSYAKQATSLPQASSQNSHIPHRVPKRRPLFRAIIQPCPVDGGVRVRVIFSVEPAMTVLLSGSPSPLFFISSNPAQSHCSFRVDPSFKLFRSPCHHHVPCRHGRGPCPSGLRGRHVRRGQPAPSWPCSWA